MSLWSNLPRLFSILRVIHYWRLLALYDFPHRRTAQIILALLFFWQRPCSISIGRGERLKSALIELGPVFVKFGQMLSTRRDLLPLDLADALADLQDNLPAIRGALARAEIERVWGCTLETHLAQFDEQALASASIAQVHGARRHDGRTVVVKFVKPGVTEIIHQDLPLLHWLAVEVEKRFIDGKRLKPRHIIRDYEHTLLNELDLVLEAGNTVQLRQNFLNSPLLYVPEIHADLVHSRVLVMERIDGIPIGDIAALKAANVNMKTLAERGVTIFFTQVFRDRFFHADMHAGNIFVDVRDPENPRYIGIDCAIIGHLQREDEWYLAENFLAFFKRDYRRIAELHIQSGWIDSRFRVEDVEGAIRASCEPIFGKALSDISFAHFLMSLFQTARRFEMEVQPQLVLLQKTLFYVEGLGRQLYPQLDLWQTALPFFEQWAREQRDPRRLWRAWRAQWPQLVRVLPDMPSALIAAVDQSAQRRSNRHEVRELQLALRRMEFRQRRFARRSLGLLLMAAGLLMLQGGANVFPSALVTLAGAWFVLARVK